MGSCQTGPCCVEARRDSPYLDPATDLASGIASICIATHPGDHLANGNEHRDEEGCNLRTYRCYARTSREVPSPTIRYAPHAWRVITNVIRGPISVFVPQDPVEKLVQFRHEGCLPPGDTLRETP